MTKQSKPMDLGYHDDVLTGLKVDFELMTVVLTVKTFEWKENNNPPENIKKEAKGEKCYSSYFDKFIQIHLKLKECEKFLLCDFSMMIPQTILWTYIYDDLFTMTLCTGHVDARIESYEIKEMK